MIDSAHEQAGPQVAEDYQPQGETVANRWAVLYTHLDISRHTKDGFVHFSKFSPKELLKDTLRKKEMELQRKTWGQKQSNQGTLVSHKELKEALVGQVVVG